MLKNDIFKPNFNFYFFSNILYCFWSHICNYIVFKHDCRYVSKNKLTIMCSIKLINRVTIKLKGDNLNANTTRTIYC